MDLAQACRTGVVELPEIAMITYSQLIERRATVTLACRYQSRYQQHAQQSHVAIHSLPPFFRYVICKIGQQVMCPIQLRGQPPW